MVSPSVSIIVPVYNIGKFLPKCIESILGQSFSDFELILVDDGSTDESSSICDYYAGKDGRIKVIHKQNGGLARARNSGLELSSGYWIMHVDGDDWIDEDMLLSLISQANSTGESVDIVDAGFRMVWDDGRMIEVLNNYELTNKQALLTSYIGYAWTTVCGGIAKRELYEKYGLRSPEGVSYCEDFHLAVRLRYYANDVVAVNKCFYNYRQRNTSLLHSYNEKQAQEEQWVYLDTIDFFKKLGEYDIYRKPLNWRLLKASQELLLDSSRHEDFLNICGDITDEEILSCWFVNKKIRCFALLVKHRMAFVVRFFLKLRQAKYLLVRCRQEI